jgi:hypothetical protein
MSRRRPIFQSAMTQSDELGCVADEVSRGRPTIHYGPAQSVEYGCLADGVSRGLTVSQIDCLADVRRKSTARQLPSNVGRLATRASRRRSTTVLGSATSALALTSPDLMAKESRHHAMTEGNIMPCVQLQTWIYHQQTHEHGLQGSLSCRERLLDGKLGYAKLPRRTQSESLFTVTWETHLY